MMIVADQKSVPIYETECSECHSKIQYRKSETSFTSYITCPVCGMSVWAEAMLPVRYEETISEFDKYNEIKKKVTT